MRSLNGFVFFALTFFSVSVESQICNGMRELCSLQINQVTLAGSHNAGAGFDGLLYYHKIAKLPAVSCLYRNQRLNITAQLDLGIRYFDIDVCWDSFYKPESPWTCHQRAFGGSIKAILEQVNAWMKVNKNDVVVLHFNRDSTNPDKAGPAIMKQINDLWGSSKIGELSLQNNQYATLGQSISDNKRIFVIMAEKLTTNMVGRFNYISEYDVGFTWTSKHGATKNDAKELIELMGENRCENEAYRHSFVRYDLYLSWGLCVDDLAALVKPFMREGVLGCHTGTTKQRKTVNFILVDYVDEAVVNVANELNKINIKNYLG